MNNSDVNFDKYVQEVSEYLKQLAADLGHPEEKARVFIIWRAVMHAIRERIHVAESFDLMSQLPLLLKGMYVNNWKFHERPPLEYEDVEGMKIEVKKFQDQYGEQQFDWSKSTEEIISITILSLSKYLTEGQFAHIKGQMPQDVKSLFP